MKVEGPRAGDRARPLEADVHLAHTALLEHADDLGDVLLSTPVGIHDGIGSIAAQLHEQRARAEADGRQRAAVEAGITAIGEQHQHGRRVARTRRARRSRPSARRSCPRPWVVRAATRRVRRLPRLMLSASPRPGLGKSRSLPNSRPLKYTDGVAGHHERVGQGDVLERKGLEHVVVLDERDAGRAVVEAVIGDVEGGVLDPLPGAGGAGLLQVVLQREVQPEVQRVAVSADAARIGGIDRLLDVRQQDGRVGVEHLAVREDMARAAIEEPAADSAGRSARSRKSSTKPCTCLAASIRNPSTPMTWISHWALRMR